MMNFTEAARFRLAEGVTYQLFDDGADGVVLAMKSGYLYSCNATAAAFLDGVASDKRLDDIASKLSISFAIDRRRACNDLMKLAEVLLHEQLVEHVG